MRKELFVDLSAKSIRQRDVGIECRTRWTCCRSAVVINISSCSLKARIQFRLNSIKAVLMDSFFNLLPVRTLQRVCAIQLIFQLERKNKFSNKKMRKLFSLLISLKQTKFCGLEIELNYFPVIPSVEKYKRGT